ncbi:MAG: universal stress protein [Draconibacterium sp.]
MAETTIHHILVPVTLDEHGINSIRQALILSRKFDSKVTLLYVAPRFSMLGKYYRPMERLHYKREAFARFKKFVKDFFDQGIPGFIRLKLRKGSLQKWVVSFIHRAKYDLVVINKRLGNDASGLRKWSDQVSQMVAEAYCPVVTFDGVPSEEEKHKILVPIDIRRRYNHNVKWAAELAKKYNAKIHLMSVLNEKMKRENSSIHIKIWKIEDWLLKQDIACETTLLRGDEKEMHKIVPDFINESKPDMVVIMTNQEVLINIKSIGKMASNVIKQSEYPVFTITPKKESLFTILIDVLKSMGKRKKYEHKD